MSGPDAAPMHAKGKPQSLRQFERALRDLGYTKREAFVIAKSGYAAVGGSDDSEAAQLVDALSNLTSILKES